MGHILDYFSFSKDVNLDSRSTVKPFFAGVFFRDFAKIRICAELI